MKYVPGAYVSRGMGYGSKSVSQESPAGFARWRCRVVMALMTVWLVACQVDDGFEDEDRTTSVAQLSRAQVIPCDKQAPDDDCDGVDEDCDGVTDEGVDLATNPFHCGGCGNDCTDRFPNAVGACTAGVCQMDACAAYFLDLNAASADGCEFFCQPLSLTDGCHDFSPHSYSCLRQ